MAKELPYSNRELNEKFKNISDKAEEHYQDLKGTLARIEAQTIRTNGTVANLKGWKNMTVGAISIISFIVIPLLVYSFNLAQQVQCPTGTCVQTVTNTTSK